MTKYTSTRGGGSPQSFEDVLLAGLAPDGGLYVPEKWPDINDVYGTSVPWDIRKDDGFLGWAENIMAPFVSENIDGPTLEALLHDTYGIGQNGKSAFHHQSIAPLVQVADNLWVMELFHGPTLAFKDVALQLLGRLFDHALSEKSQRITIVGATSGDTGSAAIEGCKHCENADIFILHPKGRVSEVQRRQMTTVDAPNVYNIAIDGTFDDCQALVKDMFGDQAFRGQVQLSAVNSINWARIMPQIVYYISAAQALGGKCGSEIGRKVSFSVPTGNFGNVYAAYVARKMGAPIGDLIVSTNRNDILTRFFETGEMSLEGVSPTLSPSMDIQISSNFERYLFDLLGRDPQKLNALMNEFKTNGKFTLDETLKKKAQDEFTAHRCNDEQTLKTIKTIYEQSGGYIVDPHTAVGVSGALAAIENAGGDTNPIVALGCAHGAKFPDAVEKAIGVRPALPPHLEDLLTRKEIMNDLPNDLAKVQGFIKSQAKATYPA